MKIFVSYFKGDAGDFAEQIRRHFADVGQQYYVFTDVRSIKVGEVRRNTIEANISKCDIFVIIVTIGALRSPNIEKEVFQALRQNKRVIPCFHRSVGRNDIKWGLDKIQVVEFTDKYELARNLYSMIISVNRPRSAISQPPLSPASTYSTSTTASQKQQPQNANQGIFQNLEYIDKSILKDTSQRSGRCSIADREQFV